MDKIPVSVIILTKNEAANIAKCIKSCSLFQEIIIVDSESSDGTQSIAASLGARVMNFHWDGKYPKKKQWILENVDVVSEWILLLDADEEPSEGLCKEIDEFARRNDPSYVAGRVHISYHFMHRELKYGQKVKKISLLKRGFCEFPPLNDLSSVGIREVEGHYQPRIVGGTLNFRSPLIHTDAEFMDSWMTRHVKYAEWESLVTSDKTLMKDVGNLKDILPRIFLKIPFRGFVMFAYSYFLKFGFLDGRVGFDYAFSKAWYYWLAGAISREKSYVEKNRTRSERK